MATITLKRGDTFQIAVETPGKDLTGYTVRSQVRRGTSLIHTLTLTDFLPGPGGSMFQLIAFNPGGTLPGATVGWPVGELLCDIEYTAPSGLVVSTETFTIECVADITV